MTRFLLVFAAACGTTSDASPSHPASTHERDSYDCQHLFAQQANCTDQFIPALVDARARLDKPAGIAAKVTADRAGVIAEAKGEWANDSKPAAVNQTCEKIVSSEDRATLDQGFACLSQSGCDAFVTCIMPVIEKHISK